MLTYFLKIGQKGFNRQILYQFGQYCTDTSLQSSSEYNRAIQRLARFSDSRESAIPIHRAYPLPLEKPSSLTLSCGLGLGYKQMILAYYLDHILTFQGMSLDFLYLVRGRRRQLRKVRGAKGGRTKIEKKKKTGKKKKKSREI